jgi:hypothetical protein
MVKRKVKTDKQYHGQKKSKDRQTIPTNNAMVKRKEKKRQTNNTMVKRKVKTYKQYHGQKKRKEKTDKQYHGQKKSKDRQTIHGIVCLSFLFF